MIDGTPSEAGASNQARTPTAVVLQRAVAFAAALGFILLVGQIQGALSASLAIIHFPYAINAWSEPPLFIELYRLAQGTAPYTPVYGADSFTYGPFYVYLLGALGRYVEAMPNVIVLRKISIGIGLAASIPLLIALGALRRKRGGPVNRWAPFVAGAFSIAALVLAEMRSPVFEALHPDMLTIFLGLSALACMLWYPLAGKRKTAVIVAMTVLCFLLAMTKFNLAPIALVLLAALVVEGSLTLTGAVTVAGSYLLALAVFFLFAPGPMRDWTLIVPAHHAYNPIGYEFGQFFADVTVGQPFHGVLIAGAIVYIALLERLRRGREAAMWAIVIGGTWLCGFVAYAKIGGNWNDFWILYAVCIIPLGDLVEQSLAVTAEQVLQRTAFQAFAVLYVLVLPWSFTQGLSVKIPPNARAVAEMDATAKQLAALCAPGKTIVVSWFPDPLLDCPGATFPLWDSIEEVTWARWRGYTGEMKYDTPVSPDVAVLLEVKPIPMTLKGKYTSTKAITYSVGDYTSYRQNLIIKRKAE